MRKNRLPFQPNQQQVDDIRRQIEVDHITTRAVAAQLGVHETTLGNLCRAVGIKTGKGGARSGSQHHLWKGGRIADKDGYILSYVPGHPHARKWGKQPPCYVAEHRLVMEKLLGRYLLPAEVVHHINGVNDDNRIENLGLYSSNADHLRHELAGRCPKWTEDGKARIQAGLLKAAAICRQRKADGALAKLQNAAHLTA